MARVTFLLVAAALATCAIPEAAQAAGDPVIGGKLFIQCRACHIINAGDRNGIGPNLNAIVERKSATREGYIYSQAITASGIVWTPANLNKFLTRPSALVPGTKMAFGGVSAQKARDDIIAYLASFKAMP